MTSPSLGLPPDVPQQSDSDFVLVQVTLQESCLVVPMVLEVKVARVQEASVTLYDYYEPRKKGRTALFWFAQWANYDPRKHLSFFYPTN